jgi:molybdopterin converting factor small subunit
MDVQVRLGPGLLQRIGTPRLTLTLPNGATVGDALASLRETYPDLLLSSDTMLAVVDGMTVDDQRILRSGAELALLFPVSGGSGRINEEGSPWLSRFRLHTKPSMLIASPTEF